jgi:HEAT repeat protein
MEREKLESLLIDYMDGKLNEADRQNVEQELVNNTDTYKVYEQLKEVVRAMEHDPQLEPGNDVKKNFDQFLQQEIAANKKSTFIFFQPAVYRVAAAIALLIMAGVTAFWMYKDQQRAQELAAIRQEMIETKRMMMAMMGNEQSASQRITGVAVAHQLEKADDEVVRVLVKTMNEDPNTNVRMAALEALSKFHTEPNVRKALIESLATQKDPVVQIALIQLLVTIKEKGVMNDLERMTKDKTIMKAVKDEAHSGILKLS